MSILTEQSDDKENLSILSNFSKNDEETKGIRQTKRKLPCDMLCDSVSDSDLEDSLDNLCRIKKQKHLKELLAGILQLRR
jgi:hypothetical protein